MEANFNSLACVGFQDDLNAAPNQTEFVAQYLMEIYEQASDEFARDLITSGGNFLNVDCDAPNHAPISVTYARGGCLTLCIGVNTCLSTQPLVIKEGSCGDVCCLSYKTYCRVPDTKDEISISGPFTGITGTDNCEGIDFPNLEEACGDDTGECIQWQFTTPCSTEPACFFD